MKHISKLKVGEDFTGISVIYFCHDGKGNFVMAKRSKNARDEQGLWEPGGGALEFNDTIENTLKRELKEEFCVESIEFEFLGYREVHRTHNGKKTHWIGFDFKVLVDPSKVKIGEPHKHDDLRWFTLDTLPKNLHSEMRRFVELYQKRLRNDHSTLELIDIVDDKCNIISSMPKKEAHEKGTLHKCVIGGVIDSHGNITLVKQNNHRQDAGQFVSPVGGHVGAGESDDDALRREAEEEIGLKSIKYKLIGKKIFNRNVIGRQENHYFIYYEIYTDEQFMLNDEAVEYKKFAPSEIKEIYKSTPHVFGDAYIFVLQSFYPELVR